MQSTQVPYIFQLFYQRVASSNSFSKYSRCLDYAYIQCPQSTTCSKDPPLEYTKYSALKAQSTAKPFPRKSIQGSFMLFSKVKNYRKNSGRMLRRKKTRLTLFEHQSASISVKQHQSALISINQHQSTSININQIRFSNGLSIFGKK